MNQTFFLKLGGSLITDKDQEHNALIPQIDGIALQLKRFIETFPKINLLLGHGSGSFGHVIANRYNTRAGVHTEDEWLGFAGVWAAARALNQIVIERLTRIDLPVIGFPLSASAVTHFRAPIDWNSQPIAAALEHHLLPLIYGDVVFDDVLGGTILSTEEQFAALVPKLKPERIFLAGLEQGVWQDFPACTTLIPVITPSSFSSIANSLQKSASVDVTGGMISKVNSMMELVQKYPEVQINIFSGQAENAIFNALSGKTSGTILRSDNPGDDE